MQSLTDLLNPKGLHRKGNIYLRSFLEDILGMNDVLDDLMNVTYVYKEYPIINDRRNDIVIKTMFSLFPLKKKFMLANKNVNVMITTTMH